MPGGRVCRGKLCSACNGDDLVPAPLRQGIQRPKEAAPPPQPPMPQGEERACQFLGRGRRVRTGVSSALWDSCGLSGQREHECPRSRASQRRHSSQGASATKLVRAEYKDTSKTAPRHPWHCPEVPRGTLWAPILQPAVGPIGQGPPKMSDEAWGPDDSTDLPCLQGSEEGGRLHTRITLAFQGPETQRFESTFRSQGGHFLEMHIKI